MRPVERGPIPIADPQTNQPKVYAAYGNARGDLIQRMGQYCSYCETRLNASLAVEHVQPKGINPDLELSWDNFLLGCTNCNSTKGSRQIILDEYFWPDIHNTFIPFVYEADGQVNLNPALTDTDKQKAQAIADLIGLQKYPDNASASDRSRWKNRKGTYEKALYSKSNLEAATAHGVRDLFIEQLIISATFAGFFSIWFKVFEGKNDVLRAWLQAFPGTHLASFDPANNFQPVKRTNEM